jgi:outer membrane biosynthesis protein TonB
VRETAGAAGQIVRQVRDESGRVIEFTVDTAGRITGARVVSGQNNQGR